MSYEYGIESMYISQSKVASVVSDEFCKIIPDSNRININYVFFGDNATWHKQIDVSSCMLDMVYT